jgi:hypothetical protein
MDAEVTPKFPTPPELVAAATPEFEVTEVSSTKKQWQLAVHAGHLALSDSPTSQPYILLREGFPKGFNFLERLRVLSVVKPFKATLKLSPEAAAAVTLWFGASFLAMAYLKRRYSFVLPWAILWMIISLPLPGNDAAGIAPQPFQPGEFLLGATLVGAWALAKWRPHPALFLVDFLWFGSLTVQLTWSIFAGRNPLWFVMVALLGGMAITGLQHFLRFRGTKMQRGKRIAVPAENAR